MIAEIRAIVAEPVIFTLPTVVREDRTVEDVREAKIFFPYYRSVYSVGELIDLVAAYNRAILRIAVSEGASILDLAGAFEARADYRKLFYDTMHPTAESNEFIAKEILAASGRADSLGDG